MSLDTLISDILCGGDHFISGINNSSQNPAILLTAIVEWAGRLNRDLTEVVSVVEPCVRQSILMSLLPAQAVDPNYRGSLDTSIRDHLASLGLSLGRDELRTLRNICINVRRLQQMGSTQARNLSTSIADLRADVRLYNAILDRQNGRCLWCGIDFSSPYVKESLEHVAPKHLGDDPQDGSNWAIACLSCNHGKSNSLAWAAKAEAHDFFQRNDFVRPNEISLAHRWSVLMRSRRCVSCGRNPKQTELWIYRRILTGLPIPANCAVTCPDCANSNSLEILRPQWAVGETNRVLPLPPHGI
jgi:hypothetical protein